MDLRGIVLTASQQVDPGTILYFMAARRIEAMEIDWSALSAA